MSSTRKTPNSEPVKVNVVGSSNFGRYNKISAERTYNMFVTTAGQPEGDDFEAWLVNFPGYQRAANLVAASIDPPNGILPNFYPTGTGRGLYNSVRGDFQLAVVNAQVYKLVPSTNPATNVTTFTVTLIGSINTTSGEVFMAENLASQICIVDGTNAWIYYYGTGTGSGTLTLQQDNNFGGSLIPNYVEYHNTYFLFGNANTDGTGASWYIYLTGLDSVLGAITILGTGVLAATELVINGVDMANTYASAAGFAAYVNTGIIPGVFAIATGSSITLLSSSIVTVSTAGTVGMNGITFANFSTTGGALSTTFGTTDFTKIAFVTLATLQTKSDFALAVKRLPGQGNNVIVFGNAVAEIWTQIGGVSVYQRNPSKNINYGCLSVRTIGESGDIIAWLGANEEESPVIMAYDGNTLQEISTDGIDFQLSQIQYPAQSTALFYRIDGHLFYQLTFYNSADNLTLLYDFDTKMFFNLTDQFGNYHPARQLAYASNNIYFLSLNNAALYQLSSTITTINENLIATSSASAFDSNLVYEITRQRITSSIREANSSRFRANSLVLTLEQGYEAEATAANVLNFLITEDGAVPPDDQIVTEAGDAMIDEDSIITPIYQPRIDLAISKDGGNTWSNNDSRALHNLGYRQNILHWENMGQANDLSFRFTFWGTNRFVINNALVDIIS